MRKGSDLGISKNRSSNSTLKATIEWSRSVQAGSLMQNAISEGMPLSGVWDLRVVPGSRVMGMHTDGVTGL